ncbi:MAG: hypothetical protein O2798_01840 [Chloroflexi bacterium]|nr:hypothetical protein [Chloroflexota bacterium]MDA1239562.1 hypothetical protein [Chloroflexota bacterium]MQC48238.1 hypothetical protein [Chloroflexota bacterium]
MTPPVLRVVGPPGSGKSLLITSLVEALRVRGYRVATAVRRDERVTVVILSHGGRVTLERPLALDALLGVIAGVDPSIHLVLAEGYEDAGLPAVELRPPGAVPMLAGADLFAVVDSEEFAATFARSGPGETNGLAERVEREVLGLLGSSAEVPAAEAAATGRLGALGRLAARLRGKS